MAAPMLARPYEAGCTYTKLCAGVPATGPDGVYMCAKQPWLVPPDVTVHVPTVLPSRPMLAVVTSQAFADWQDQTTGSGSSGTPTTGSIMRKLACTDWCSCWLPNQNPYGAEPKAAP